MPHSVIWQMLFDSYMSRSTRAMQNASLEVIVLKLFHRYVREWLAELLRYGFSLKDAR